MIITHLMGGLGNQMFEYAAGLALARRRRTVLKLDTTFYQEHDVDDRHYSLDCLNVPAQFATEEEIWRLKGGLTRQEKVVKFIHRKLGLRRYAEILDIRGQAHFQKMWAYYPEFADLPDNTWVYGNYQSEKFFSPVSDILRQHFTFRYPPTASVEAMAASIKNKPSVAVHFRRGDYLDKYSNIGALSLEYYQSAIDYLRPKISSETVYYIFSDDIEAVEREFQPSVNSVFVKCCDHANYFDKIRLMALCDHNIIANSTFSWWAAWLNSNPRKIVIAPRRWFTDASHQIDDLFPSGWVVI